MGGLGVGGKGGLGLEDGWGVGGGLVNPGRANRGGGGVIIDF